jgi:type VI secretion system secreted protein Hcp
MVLHGRVPRISLALIVAAALALATVAIVNTQSSSHHAAPKPVTLETALAALSGPLALYLHIDTIPGESTTQGHENDIEVTSYSWGLSNHKGSAKGASFQDITISKFFDAASPKLMLAAAQGTNLGHVVLSADKTTSGQSITVVKLELDNTVVTSFQNGVGAGAGISESISLQYSKITLSYFKQNPTGGTAPPIVACWNLMTKSNCTPPPPG